MKSPYRIFFFLLITAGSTNVFGQRELIKLPNSINHPAINVSHPFVSGDGNTIMYLSDYTDVGGLTMYWSRKNGAAWSEGVEVPRLVNRPDLNLEGAFSLNLDGSLVIVTARKEGLGGYDLFYSTRSGTNWSATRNYGAPINSNSNEGAAVLTSDGKGMYFMRCSQMNEQIADGCQLFFSELKYDKWQEPVKLPQNINSYNPQMPRISADGNTLIFTSKSSGGQGGYDLYMTRKSTEGAWENPINLDFINTPADEKFVSFGARGRYLFSTLKGSRTTELVQTLIPEELRPKSIYTVDGKITNGNEEPIPAELIIMDITNKKLLKKTRISGPGSFSFTLTEGATYDVSFEPIDKNLKYYSRIFDLQEVPSRDRETIIIKAAPVQINTAEANENIYFEQNSAVLDYKSQFEIRRIANLLRQNPQLGISIKSILYDFKEDTIQSDPDLTEVRIDTTFESLSVLVPSHYLNTSLSDTVLLDSLGTNGTYYTNESDTIMIMVEVDSIHLQNKFESVALPSRKLLMTKTYHNDRSVQEAEALKFALINEGVEAEKITTEGLIDSINNSEKKKIKIIELMFYPIH